MKTLNKKQINIITHAIRYASWCAADQDENVFPNILPIITDKVLSHFNAKSIDEIVESDFVNTCCMAKMLRNYEQH